MSDLLRLYVVGAIVCGLVACGSGRPDGQAAVHEAQDSYGKELGGVAFPTSCNDLAQAHVERGVALLHHMTYAGSEKYFKNAIQADPDCAIARWGLAMSWVHPLWPDVTNATQFDEGLRLLAEAAAIDNKTAREADYIAAADAYYSSRGEPEALRLAKFEQGWRRVYDNYPEDLEGKSFYALSLIATAKLNKTGLAVRAEAGEIVEAILDRAPDHPGAHHYVIHAYDTPSFAEQALAVANEYGNVAPNVAHALHMPSHIFTRLGLWPESIDMNERSAEASFAAHPGETSPEYLHALDYQVYAQLQMGKDASAGRSVDIVLQIGGPYVPVNPLAAAYALAAIPARYALERQDWTAATRVRAHTPGSFDWGEQYAAFEAISYFANGVGGARNGDLETAHRALDDLARVREHIVGTSADQYWAAQIDVQIQTVQAWVALAQENTEGALALMREAAQIEAGTDKHAVTPGEILPAQEQLGDMLLAVGEPALAREAYEAELRRSPNRFNTLYGAARAAEQAGDSAAAAGYYQRLVQNCREAEVERPRLREARSFLAS